ncbi:MAG: WXG100 family type VII secretion target [Lachnospiraceae bacterium]|nr:WXG100 family type VII secretion target [Lachnospiraceae bacterium]
MAEAVKLSYGDMLEYCGRLKSLATQYSDTAQQVTNVVSAFTGVWEGTAEAKFEEDYQVLTKAMTTAIDTMQEITTLAENYVNTMQEVENAYGVNHVTVG